MAVLGGGAVAVLGGGAAAGGVSFSISDDDTEVDDEVADDFKTGGSVAARCNGSAGVGSSVIALMIGAGGGSVIARVTRAGDGIDSKAFFSV